MLIFFNFRPRTGRTNAEEGRRVDGGKTTAHSHINRRKNGNILPAINRRQSTLWSNTHLKKKEKSYQRRMDGQIVKKQPVQDGRVSVLDHGYIINEYTNTQYKKKNNKR